MTELERRDTPAWWSVAAPVPAAGVAGTTDATQSGGLTLNPDYAATNGTITVWADTAIEAAAKGINGTVTVTLLGQSVAYEFSPETVGTSAADHKAFFVVANGSSVSIKLEDMAGRAGSDWDYDDRTWGGVAVSSATSGPVVMRLDNQVWPCAQVPGDFATVTSIVTMEQVNGKAAYKWLYEVTNTSVDWIDPNYNPNDPPSGLAGVNISGSLTLSGQPNVWGPPENDMGWDTYPEGFGGEGNAIFWVSSSLGGTGDMIYVGDVGRFWYYTAPLPIVAGGGEYFSEGLAGGGGGPALQPSVNAVQVMIAYPSGAPAGADGLKVGKWENAFNVAGGTARVKPVAANGFNIIDLDPDRFNVWVYDKAKWDANTQHASVKISTDNVVGFTNYNDTPTAVDMVRYTGTAKGQGWFWSDSQLLVSNKVDDVDAVPGVGTDEADSKLNTPEPLKHGYQWNRSDRTHRVALRGTVKAEYNPDAGPAVSDSKAVPMRHYVNADVRIMSVPPAVLTMTDANKEFVQANEQFAQVGLLIIPQYENKNMSITPDKNLVLADGMEECTLFDINNKIVMTTEEKLLLGQDYNIDSIRVFFDNYLAVGGVWKGNFAEAFPHAYSPESRYEDTVIVGVDHMSMDFRTVGHELGHILTNFAHYNGANEPANLMSEVICLSDSLDAPKRLTTVQDNRIHNERLVLLK